MTHLLDLVVPGEPCGKQRPKFVRATGRAAYGGVAVAPGVVGAAEKMIFVAVKFK